MKSSTPAEQHYSKSSQFRKQRFGRCDSRDRRATSLATRSGTAKAVGTDVIGSLQSLLGTVVIAVFVITFIVQAFQIPLRRWKTRC